MNFWQFFKKDDDDEDEGGEYHNRMGVNNEIL
jgi:hypothetical protein